MTNLTTVRATGFFLSLILSAAPLLAEGRGNTRFSFDGNPNCSRNVMAGAYQYRYQEQSGWWYLNNSLFVSTHARLMGQDLRLFEAYIYAANCSRNAGAARVVVAGMTVYQPRFAPRARINLGWSMPLSERWRRAFGPFMVGPVPVTFRVGFIPQISLTGTASTFDEAVTLRGRLSADARLVLRGGVGIPGFVVGVQGSLLLVQGSLVAELESDQGGMNGRAYASLAAARVYIEAGVWVDPGDVLPGFTRGWSLTNRFFDRTLVAIWWNLI